MYNQDYSKEVGLDTGEKIVPLRYLIPIVAVLAALCWIGFVALERHQDGRRAISEQAQPATRL